MLNVEQTSSCSELAAVAAVPFLAVGLAMTSTSALSGNFMSIRGRDRGIFFPWN